MNNEKAYKSTVRGLRFILILSLIGSAYSFISDLVTGLVYPAWRSLYESGEWKSMLPMLAKMTGQEDLNLFETAMEQAMAVPRTVYLLWALLYAMSLAGVIMMLRLRRNGFHLYAIAQLLVLIVTILFLGKAQQMLGDIMMTILFIVYYFFTFRRLEQFKPAEEGASEDAPTAEE